jgi:plastocyanin
MIGRLFILLAALVIATGAAQTRPRPRTHTVTIAEMRFTPETLSVASGDLIVWVNKDIVQHTATSKDAGFDSKTIEPGASWSVRVKKAGKFGYVCTLHPTMKATLQVK